jgi:hypothetical protein
MRKRRSPDRPSEDEYAARVARTEELLARARAILGRDPRDDVASELRAYLADPPERSERVEELAELLREEGIVNLDDVVGRARAFIADAAVGAHPAAADVGDARLPTRCPACGDGGAGKPAR